MRIREIWVNLSWLELIEVPATFHGCQAPCYFANPVLQRHLCCLKATCPLSQMTKLLCHFAHRSSHLREVLGANRGESLHFADSLESINSMMMQVHHLLHFSEELLKAAQALSIFLQALLHCTQPWHSSFHLFHRCVTMSDAFLHALNLLVRLLHSLFQQVYAAVAPMEHLFESLKVASKAMHLPLQSREASIHFSQLLSPIGDTISILLGQQSINPLLQLQEPAVKEPPVLFTLPLHLANSL
mmetsp:Transcript_50269/g.92892  ORF Transcript_50269/g.92892 Transcript_50269/m.92892 type:complete len:243 (-) Transcript_50269:393-1121(-)